MTDRELMQQALEALEEFCEHQTMLRPIEKRDALRERLAQPEQEPVAHTLNCVCGAVWDVSPDGVEEMVHAPNPPQRQWQGLTEQEIKDCEKQAMVNGALPFEQRSFFARAIEAKLKEKNT